MPYQPVYDSNDRHEPPRQRWVDEPRQYQPVQAPPKPAPKAGTPERALHDFDLSVKDMEAELSRLRATDTWGDPKLGRQVTRQIARMVRLLEAAPIHRLELERNVRLARRPTAVEHARHLVASQVELEESRVAFEERVKALEEEKRAVERESERRQQTMTANAWAYKAVLQQLRDADYSEMEIQELFAELRNEKG